MKLCRVLVVNATALKWLYTFMQVWSFKGRELKSIVSVGSPVLKMVTHQGNGLSAFPLIIYLGNCSLSQCNLIATFVHGCCTVVVLEGI
jgi:hypothetical protein